MDNQTKKPQPGTKFIEILSKIDKEHPSEEKLRDIQNYFSENEVDFLPLQRLSQNLITSQIKKTFTTSKELSEQLEKGAEALRHELGYAASSTIEQLLIDEIILEFLRNHQMQLLLTELTTRSGTELRTIKKAGELASAAQNRFNKAVLMLTKLRKPGIRLQINIATEGGKQINLQK